MIINIKLKNMINAKELRIENLVDFNGQVETVYAIINSGVDFYRGKTKKSVIMQYYVWEAIKPIPLTKEWLLKFGFNEVECERWCDMHEKFEECDYYYLDKLKIYYNPETDRFEDDNLFHFNINLKYVHQLQNLYFALTGSELTGA